MTVIAISSEFGSYGDEIASEAAKSLGFHLADQTEIHRLAEQCDDEFKKACALFEREEPSGFWQRFFFHQPSYESLFEALTYDLASKGNVVIMGRGAAAVLREIRAALRVRIVAPAPVRVERVMQRRGVSREEAEDIVLHHERRRRKMLEAIYHIDLSDWSMYDLVLNTEKMAPDEGAHIIAEAVHRIKAVDPERETKDYLSQLALAKHVECAIRKEVPADITGSISATPMGSGTIALSGLVSIPSYKNRAVEIATRYPGVEKVDDRVIFLKPRGV